MPLSLALVAGLALAQLPDARPDPAARARRRTPVVEVVERAGPAVVNIATEVAEAGNPFARRGDPWDDLFQQFFGGRRDQRQQSLGSGVIVDSSGVVLTNEHVIARATSVTITLSDRRTFECDVLGADPAFDLAVLKARGARNLPVAALGSSADLMPGETLVAIGNPFGLSNTVTTGVVSALHRSIDVRDRRYEDFIQTDAPINPGNSGGALLDIEGRLIGINTAIYDQANGIGFAIPIDKARAVVEEVLRFGEVRPAFLGLLVDAASAGGARVRAVVEGSPAAAAGLRAGDVVVDVGGQEVRGARGLRQIERALVPGTRVTVSVERPGRGKLALSLAVQELPRATAARLGQARLGLEVEARQGRLVITSVARGSGAARVGVRAGDLLLALGGRRVTSREELEALAAALLDAEVVPAVIGRGGRAYALNLELAAGEP
jgi:serine protease Do